MCLDNGGHYIVFLLHKSNKTIFLLWIVVYITVNRIKVGIKRITFNQGLPAKSVISLFINSRDIGNMTFSTVPNTMHPNKEQIKLLHKRILQITVIKVVKSRTRIIV